MRISETFITNSATTTGVTAAMLMALNLDLFMLCYTLFITSSILWSIYAYNNDNRQLLIMNVVFSLINLVGLVRFS